jgi:putative glycosyltransferase (TIGR04372 family)
VVAPREEVANRALLGCYAEHVTLLEDAEEIEKTVAAWDNAQFFVDYLTMPGGQTLHRELAYGLVQRMWWDQGRPAPIGPPPEIDEAGRAFLRHIGVPEDGWFVALHVREPGFYRENLPWAHNKARNAQIENYLPAIETITARGGWVLRMGDPTMTPLPPLPQVFDYARSPDRRDWLDVFVFARCRFFLGTASGPMNVARAFCRPVAATDYFPVGTWPFGAQDVFIHKLHRETASGRLLPICEVTRPPLLAAWNPLVYEGHGIEVVDNTPEEIVDAVLEMFEVLHGGRTYSAEEAALQQKFQRLADPHRLGYLLPIAKAFLTRHPHLLSASR